MVKIIVVVEGGLIQEIVTNCRADVKVLDYDILKDRDMDSADFYDEQNDVYHNVLDREDDFNSREESLKRDWDNRISDLWKTVYTRDKWMSAVNRNMTDASYNDWVDHMILNPEEPEITEDDDA